jgi:hypothetical protein
MQITANSSSITTLGAWRSVSAPHEPARTQGAAHARQTDGGARGGYPVMGRYGHGRAHNVDNLGRSPSRPRSLWGWGALAKPL